MKNRAFAILLFTILSGISSPLSIAFAQGTAFTYQGHLSMNGLPANGNYDLVFSLFNTNNTGMAIAGPVTNTAVVVRNGLFATLVDFGYAYTGGSNWLELAVSTNAANSFSTLAPRQQLTPVPYAVFATSASNMLGTVSAGQLSGNIPAAAISGTIPWAQLPGNVISNGASGVVLSGTFSGNGAGMTNLNLNAFSPVVGTTNILGWGGNSHGEMTIPSGLTNVTAIAAGAYHNLALKSDGTVAGWGSNDHGETSIPAGLSNVTAIAAGVNHSVALKSDGTVAAWGDDTYGQTDVPAGLANVTAIAAGDYHNLALKSDGTVVGWGYNGSGETSIPHGLTDVTAIAAGFQFSLALNRDGTVIGWGDNSGGEAAIPPGLTNVTAIACGVFDGLALKGDGTVVGWGDAGGGEVTIPVGLTNVTAIAAGTGFSLALKSDGTVVGWGDNSYGETSIPAALSHVLAIAAGGESSLALERMVSTPAVEVNGIITAAALVGDGSGLTSLKAGNLTGTISAANSFPVTLVTNLINTPGPLPLSKSFTSHGGNLIINTSGSGTINSVTAMGMTVSLDGTIIETNKIWSNVVSAHLAFVPKNIVRTGVAAGLHTITLSSWGNTISDLNDNFNVTIQEMPY